ncbi:MAG: 1-acyl-sn-glycerol-3-phosphate acyltransferase [Odoribacter sp.]|nr:1-acyl-sn-glycerol-3-phosphate acyltransferase [Odoribacter sp.]
MDKDTAIGHDGPIKIDLSQILKSRKATARIPGFVVRRLERLICQDSLNEMLQVAYPRRGAQFCRAVLDHLDIKVAVSHADRLPLPSKSVIYVCNHPLGGLDGMALIEYVSRRHGVEPLFVVNDLLMAVEPLSDVFLPINKHGSQSRGAVAGIDAAMASDRPVIIFPAGLCSRLINGRVTDLEWQKMFIIKARHSGRIIVPLYFRGHNTGRFYNLARWRKRLGIKFNMEMVLLPSEVFKARGKHFEIICGAPVDPSSLSADARGAAAEVRRIADDLVHDTQLPSLRESNSK